MRLVALRDWYPRFGDWTGTPVLPADRVGWVLHHTVGGTGQDPEAYARGVADYHYGKWGVPGGYNYLVGEDGVIRVMCGLAFQGVHAGTTEWNRKSLGLAFQGDFRNQPPSDLMLEAAAELIADTPTPAVQWGHRDVRPEPTTCPGQELYDLLPLEAAEMKPPSWARDATQWHIDNDIYSEQSPDDVDESIEFHRQSVFRHRFYQKVVVPALIGQHDHDGRYVRDVTVER